MRALDDVNEKKDRDDVRAHDDVNEKKDRDDVRARDDVYEKNKIGMTCPGDASMMYQEKILLNFFKKLLFFNKSLISLHIEKQ